MGDLDLVERKLRVQSPLPPTKALEKARYAVLDLGRVSLMKAEIVGESDDGFLVQIKPATPVGILADDTSFVVEAKDEEGSTVVTAEIVECSVYQERILFMKVGPKSVPGAKLYAAALEAIERAL